MSEQNKNKNRCIHLRVSELEYRKIKLGFSSSTQRKMSEYVPNILLGKPITVYTCNRIFGDFVAEMILLRRELKGLEIILTNLSKNCMRWILIRSLNYWAAFTEITRQSLLKKTEEIYSKINQAAIKWSQE